MTTADRTGPAEVAGDNALLDLLRRQRALYRTLLELGAEQRQLVAGEDATALLSLLGRRQQIVDELSRVDGLLGRIRIRWADHYRALQPQVRQQVDALLTEINESLAAIMAMDREDAETLSRRTAQVGAALSEAPKRRQVNAAYAGTASTASRYIDHTDEHA